MGEKGTIYQRTTKGPYYFLDLFTYNFFSPQCPVGYKEVTGISIIWHHEIDSVEYAWDNEILKMDRIE